ncbi:MAG: hypothetical protein AB1352_04210 [Patescibacteria group bacterium]
MILLRLIKYLLHYLNENIVMPRLLTRKYRAILACNASLKWVMKGKRCFIIGGGPSVKQFDAEKLSQEHTFTVNEFDSHPQYQKLHPTHHVMIDTAYFSQGEEHYLTQQFLKKTSTIAPDTSVFLNIHARPFVEKRTLFPHHRVYYICTHGLMSEKVPFQLELDKTVPWPKNSILMCLVIAYYLGYERMYLLGCEHNFLSTPIGRKNLTYDHSYKDERANVDLTDAKEVKKYGSERDFNMTYEKNVANIKQLFKNYRLFWKRVQRERPQVQIYNATPNSFLDVFPSIDFDDIKF